MGVSAKVHMNPLALATLSKAVNLAAIQTATQMLAEEKLNEVMPYRTGYLQNGSTSVDSTQVSKGLVKIVSTADYAVKVYFHPEWHFRTTHNANAQGEWWEPWISGDKADKPQKLFKDFYRKLAGGYVK